MHEKEILNSARCGTSCSEILLGNSLVDPTKKRFHLSQSLVYDKGYALKNQPQFKIGGGKVELSKIEPAEIQCLDKEFASLQVLNNYLKNNKLKSLHLKFFMIISLFCSKKATLLSFRTSADVRTRVSSPHTWRSTKRCSTSRATSQKKSSTRRSNRSAFDIWTSSTTW